MSLTNTHHGAEAIGSMLKHCKTLLFIGVGGVSMCSLAELALSEGFSVIGTDRVDGSRLERLRRLGADIRIGHSADHAVGADAAIYTVAIDGENPEYLAMKEAGKPLISRADYLGYAMTRYRTRIGIAGMNGKSTTTAMCGHILRGAGNPTVFGGAEASTLGGASCLIGKQREQMVFEACEYKDSFLDFSPNVAVILNVGLDHVDYFADLEQIIDSFHQYADLVGENGTVIVNRDDENAMRAVQGCRGKLVTYGVDEMADFYAVNITEERGCRRFDLMHDCKKLCRIRLLQPGKYQVENALAASVCAYLCGVSPEVIEKQIATFVGVRRRMEYRGTLNGAVVYDDYAHHPTAIQATLAGAREMGYDRVLCVYQPHTYSRTAGLFEEFSQAFEDADRVFFADIYAAREENVSGVTSAQLAEAVGEKASYASTFEELSVTLSDVARPGDLILVMGAGDIENLFSILPLKL